MALIIDPVEDTATQVPMLSRILHLLIIDILAVGVAVRLGAKHGVALAVAAAEDLAETQPLRPPSLAAQRVAPGISTAGPLARLTSHCG